MVEADREESDKEKTDAVEANTLSATVHDQVVRYAVNGEFNQAVLFFDDGSYVQFEHTSRENRWAKASRPETRPTTPVVRWYSSGSTPSTCNSILMMAATSSFSRRRRRNLPQMTLLKNKTHQR